MATPDLEALIIGYLSSHPTVSALCSGRVSGSTPPSTKQPWVRVFLLSDELRTGSAATHAIDGMLQLDCYGSDQQGVAHGQASLLARACRQALREIPDTGLPATVSHATASIRRLPDTDFAPARERFVVTCELVCHA